MFDTVCQYRDSWLTPESFAFSSPFCLCKDQYPTEQNVVPGANSSGKATAGTPTAAAEASDTAASGSTTLASVRGRPPRP